MCKSKSKTDATDPNSTSRISRSTRTTKSSETSRTPKTSISDQSSTNFTSGNYSNGSSYNRDSSRTSIWSKTSLSSLRDSIPENPHIYDFSEICFATNNFHAKRFSSPSASATAWRCSIRDKDVVIFQRKFRRSIETSELRERLSLICRSHHVTLTKLLGVSLSGDYIYLVYDYVNGSNLTNCLRNPRNPNFTVLSNWISRMQIATDLAQGLEYIHHYSGLNIGLVHKHIKSTSVIVIEPSFNAKICHFGAAELCGDIAEISNDASTSTTSKLKKSGSRIMKLEGTRGYMSPEFQSDGVATQKSDVFAFGVVILELLSGAAPLQYIIDEENGVYKRISVIETAREAIESDEAGTIRKWVDRRLKDSFPVEVAEEMTRVALDCVHVEANKRPDMRHVAGNISKLYLESKTWAESMNIPTDFTVSFAAR